MSDSNLTRRNFIRGAAAGAVGLAAANMIPAAFAAEPEAAAKANIDETNGPIIDLRKDAQFINANDVKTASGNGKIRYRWNGCVFNEIILPNGKEIVIDPYWYGVDNQYIADNTVEAGKWVKGADYMIITHTHGDHVADVPSILDWYPMCQVVCPLGGLAEFADQYGLGATRYALNGVVSGDHLEFEDFSLDVFGGRHTFNTKQQVIYQQPNTVMESKSYQDSEGNVDAHKMLFSQWGGLHFCNYLITTKPEGFKILIYGGMLNFDPFKYQMVGMKPDLMFYQAANPNLGNPYYGTSRHVNLTPETLKTDELADFVASVEAGMCMPSHQEKFSMDMLNLIGQKCAQRGIEKGIKTQYFIPKSNEWYVFDKDVCKNVTVGTAAVEPEKRKDPVGLSLVNS